MLDPSAAVLSQSALFHGRYRVVRCIKAGGMGAVYEVVDEKIDARRALKVMLPGLVADPDMRARFAQEARVTGHIESEHIVRTSDAGVDEATGTPFIVMDLLRGEELGSLVERRGTLPRGEVVAYLHQAALALDKTHALGIVHRDLKPENLFLTRRDDGSPCLKILDFGIAKVTAQTNRGRGTKSIGTPLYMSPEQARGEAAIGPRSDLYTLGHIAHALLAGEPYWEPEWRESGALLPFFQEIAAGVREPPSARAERLGVALPTAFDGWFLKATALSPQDRFDRATTAVRALAAALDVAIPRPSLPDLDDADETSPDPGVETAPPSDDRTEPAPRSAGTLGVATTAPAPRSAGKTRVAATVPAPRSAGRTRVAATVPMRDADHAPSGRTSAALTGDLAPPRSTSLVPAVLAGAALAIAAVVFFTLRTSPVPSDASSAAGAKAARTVDPGALVTASPVASASTSVSASSDVPSPQRAPAASASAPVASARAGAVRPPPAQARTAAPAAPAHEGFF